MHKYAYQFIRLTLNLLYIIAFLCCCCCYYSRFIRLSIRLFDWSFYVFRLMWRKHTLLSEYIEKETISPVLNTLVIVLFLLLSKLFYISMTHANTCIWKNPSANVMNNSCFLLGSFTFIEIYCRHVLMIVRNVERTRKKHQFSYENEQRDRWM